MRRLACVLGVLLGVVPAARASAPTPPRAPRAALVDPFTHPRTVDAIHRPIADLIDPFALPPSDERRAAARVAPRDLVDPFVRPATPSGAAAPRTAPPSPAPAPSPTETIDGVPVQRPRALREPTAAPTPPVTPLRDPFVAPSPAPPGGPAHTGRAGRPPNGALASVSR